MRLTQVSLAVAACAMVALVRPLPARATAGPIALPQPSCTAYAGLAAAEAAGWTATDDPGGGTYISCPSYSMVSPSLGGKVSRSYWVYVPPGYDGVTPWPMVVALHGCTQQGPDLAYISLIDADAAANHYVVVYPNQAAYTMLTTTTFDGNGSYCWNWFLPQGQGRGDDEPALIAGITRTVRDAMRVDPDRVDVIGISAGGAMTDVMAATYPDIYAAAAVLAGCEYNGLPCLSSVSAQPPQLSAREAYQAYAAYTGAIDPVTAPPRVMPFLVENGDADTTVPVANAFDVVQQMQLTNYYAENGLVALPPAPGTVCSDQRVVPSPAVDTTANPPIAYNPYDILSYTVDGSACPPSFDASTACAQLYVVHGEEHAWPGGPNLTTTQSSAQIYSNPGGPPFTDIAWRFFAAHPMSAGVAGCGAAPPAAVPEAASSAALPAAAGALLLATVVRRRRRSTTPGKRRGASRRTPS
ncbi:MAG: extracellular catalytic domain type 1 short-chain-length polyhydroxyalkanoate depolymerase [Candidatus Dormibacteria bacterium]